MVSRFVFGIKFESKNKTIQMKPLKVLVIVVFILSSCSSISFVPAKEKPPKHIRAGSTIGISDEDANVIVRSGFHRDNRMGYYFDSKDGKCKLVLYSTGSSCVPPPYKTMDECISCKEQRNAAMNH